MFTPDLEYDTPQPQRNRFLLGVSKSVYLIWNRSWVSYIWVDPGLLTWVLCTKVSLDSRRKYVVR